MSSNKTAGKTVFVTVGTTEFDSLIKEVVSDKICNVLKSRGYRNVVLQIGRGSFEPESIHEDNFNLTYFRFKDSIVHDVSHADLVICHAGAGSVLEGLEAGRHLVVVINEELMGNHQAELAQQFHKMGNLYYSNVRNLHSILSTCNFDELKPYDKGKPEVFSKNLDTIMGFL